MILLLLIGLIAIIGVITIFKIENHDLYPFIIFIISLSLLYHTSLISMYLTGWDVNNEFLNAANIINNSFWNILVSDNNKGMLSISIFAPLFSILSNLNLTFVFKIIYPFIYSLVPVGLYEVYKNLTNEKIAFISCFFFMSIPTFYMEMVSLGKQQIAEFFLILILILIINRKYDIKNSILILFFSFSLIVSHYALSYLFMFILIGAFLLNSEKITNTFKNLKNQENFRELEKKTISLTFVTFFVVVTIFWYIYISGSYSFVTIVTIINQIQSSLFTDFLNPQYAQGLELIQMGTSSPLHQIAKYLQYVAQFLILVGFLSILKSKKDLIIKELSGFSILALLLLILAIIIPNFSSSLNTTRLYHIALIFLSPFAVIGGIEIFKIIITFFNHIWTKRSYERSLKLLAIFFSIFLLFNTGFIYDLVNDHPTSLISKAKLEMGDKNSLNTLYGDLGYTTDQDVYGAIWLNRSMNTSSRVYSDGLYRGHVLTSYGMLKDVVITTNDTPILNNSYLYLGFLNVRYSLLYLNSSDLVNINPFLNKLISTNKVYDNGGSQIFFKT